MFKFVALFALVADVFGAAIPNGLLPQLDGRIVGGDDTSIALHPYVISLQRSGSHTCGGSLYSNRIVVTAAHCLQNVAVNVLKVRVGSTNWNRGGDLVSAASFVNNPNYDPITMVYDIAVIKLATPLSLGPNIKTINMVLLAPADGTTATVVGWGTLKAGASTIPSTLQSVNVDIISMNKCGSGTYSYASKIKPTMICAAAMDKDACQGDSGGPLTTRAGQVGVVSWGYGCAAAKFPGVYADVAALRPWIVSNAAELLRMNTNTHLI